MFALPALAKGGDGEDPDGGGGQALTKQQLDDVLKVIEDIVVGLGSKIPAVERVLHETPTDFLNPCFELTGPNVHNACHDTLRDIQRHLGQEHVG